MYSCSIKQQDIPKFKKKNQVGRTFYKGQNVKMGPLQYCKPTVFQLKNTEWVQICFMVLPLAESIGSYH